jgi:hypothetical protein
MTFTQQRSTINDPDQNDLNDLDGSIVRALQLREGQRDGRLLYSQFGSKIGLGELATRQRVNRPTERGSPRVRGTEILTSLKLVKQIDNWRTG